MGQRVRRAGDDYWVSTPGDRVDDVSWAREGRIGSTVCGESNGFSSTKLNFGSLFYFVLMSFEQPGRNIFIPKRGLSWSW